MRPAHSNTDSALRFTTSTGKPLIADSFLGYNRRFLLVDHAIDPSTRIPVTGDVTSGEAEMDENRPHRTKPYSTVSNSIVDPSTTQPETIEERLARIRAEIDAGVYETPEKLEIAISRMLGVIAD